MKASLVLMLLGVLLCFVCILQLLHLQNQIAAKSEVPVIKSEPVRRESITFILGDDRETNNPYYREAASYYSTNAEGLTDYVVGVCRSLVEVRDYLEKHAPCNGAPWGLVNLVTHGNQWVGMSVKVSPGGKRSSPVNILESVKDGSFLPLPASVLDRETEVFIHGCGLGNDHALLDAVALAFGGEGNKPIVRASRLFSFYATSFNGQELCTQRYIARAWFVSYPMGATPTIWDLSKRLREKYPRDDADFLTALRNAKPRWAGDYYHHAFQVPLRMIVPSEDLSHIPVDDVSRLAFVKGSLEVMRELKALDMEADDFRWEIQRVYVKGSNGERTSAYKVTGHSTILTVIHPLTLTDSGYEVPFRPDVNDPEYYAFSM